MTSEIEWAEPPAPVAPDWNIVAAELRANPGKWARLKSNTTDNALATVIRHAQRLTWTPKGAYESRAVSVAEVDGQKRYDIYARYVGAGESA